MDLTAPSAPRRLVTIGGYTFDWDPANVPTDILLVVGLNHGSANRYNTMRRSDGASGYQVGAGKTLRIIAAKMVKYDTTATPIGLIGKGTSDVGLASAAAPAGNIDYGNAAYIFSGAASGVPAAGIEIGGLDFSVPATYYPYYAASAAAAERASVYFYCKLI